ncbi:MAG: branched-chain amino acid ABC transporter permease [Thermodesulfobacteriota bacterium]
MFTKKWRWISIGVGFLFLVTAPLFLTGYWIRFLTNVFMFGVMAEGFNILAGFCGIPSFGNVVFFGLGAYTTCIFMVQLHQPFIAGVVAGAILSTLFAILLGFPILRLKGHYFAIGTLGLSEATKELVTNLEKITKGSEGISLPVIAGNVNVIYAVFYFTMFGIMISIILFTYWMSKTRLGYAFQAIRSDEEAALVTGINTAWYKTIAWSVCAFFTGLVGGVYAYWTTFINPEGVFSVGITVKMLIMTILGGSGTILGPIIGAFIFEFLSELAWSSFMNVHAAFLGLLFILIVIFMPNGFMQLITQRFSLSSLIAQIKENRI